MWSRPDWVTLGKGTKDAAFMNAPSDDELQYFPWISSRIDKEWEYTSVLAKEKGNTFFLLFKGLTVMHTLELYHGEDQMKVGEKVKKK